MKKILFLIAATLFVCSAALAKVNLPDIFSDNMVLQQNSDVKIWGSSEPRATVKITTSWGVKTSIKSDEEGKWTLTIRTPQGSYTPQGILIESGEKIHLQNILIGEVWLAGGQSNMDMPLRGFHNCPIRNANRTIAQADKQRNKIHFVTINRTPAYTPQERATGRWQEFTSETAAQCSATAYHFATTLNEVIDVPIGIIACAWGGSRVESWCSREVLDHYPDVDLSKSGIEAVRDFLRPLLMYNGMLHPLAGYGIRGFIWYQGESNVGAHDVYADRMADMVKLWRTEWGLGELPFYFVEIAPYAYGNNREATDAALLREAQYRASQEIPSSGMISTVDLVEEYEAPNIHPAEKQKVGERLAYWALNRNYGHPGIVCEGPTYKEMKIEGNKIVVTFNHAEEGFDRMDDIRGFEVCGADRIFHPAKATIISHQRLAVASPEVSEPIAVRYCFHNFQLGNLKNLRDLPIVPFRSDSF